MEQTIQSAPLADPVAQPVESTLVEVEYSPDRRETQRSKGLELNG